MNIIYKWLNGVAKSSKSNLDAASYFMFLWCMFNFAFYAIEHVFWGDSFFHIGDAVLALAMAYAYVFACIFRIKNENSNRS